MNNLIDGRYSPQYARMHEEAHKRGILAQGAPSFSWQLAYMVETPMQAYNSVAEHKELDAFSETTIETYAQKMFDSVIHSVASAADEDNASELLKTAEQHLKVAGPKSIFLSVDGVLVKIIVGDHSDHFTVTITVDLSKHGHNEDTAFDESVILLNTPDSVFRTRVHQAYAYYADAVSGDTDKAKDEAKYNTAVRYMKDGIWEDLYEFLLEDSLLTKNAWPANGSTVPEVFADIRSVFLNCRDPEWYHQSGATPQKSQLVGHEKPFETKEQKETALKALLPLFTVDDPSFRYRELVACTIFRERAVYVSPLGSRPFNVKIANRDAKPRPIYFAVALTENNRWQIGRMVRRINSMGCIRLLALRDLDKIKEASDQVRIVGNDLDDRFRNQTTETKDKETDIDADRKALSTFKDRIDEIGTNISGHLPYRIYRSQFRSDQFRKQVEDLYVDRIEGWQPYDEFVRRRLYPTFDFIARVGQRFERLNRNYQSQLASLDLEMQSVSSQHLVEIQHEILDSHSFQHLIETIALAYYGGYIFFFVSKPYMKDYFSFLKEQDPILPKEVGAFLYDVDAYKSIVFAASTVFAIRRMIRKEREHKEKVAAAAQPKAKRANGKAAATKVR
ncbi:MAG: DUF3422 family protein [Pseudomonadota bacterium]